MPDPNPSRRILVIEDDPDIAALIRLHLDSAGKLVPPGSGSGSAAS